MVQTKITDPLTPITPNIPLGVKYLQIEMIGAGGSGASGISTQGGCGGGQAGAYVKVFLDLSPPNLPPIISMRGYVGVGGAAPSNTLNSNGNIGDRSMLLISTASSNSWIYTYGGDGGYIGNNSVPVFSGSGGYNVNQNYEFVNLNSNYIIDTLFVQGAAGHNAACGIPSTSYSSGGNGGASFFGGGGKGSAFIGTSVSPATKGPAFGSGGGGGCNYPTAGGGNGADGIIIITYIQ
jgi:hypothetical protein